MATLARRSGGAPVGPWHPPSKTQARPLEANERRVVRIIGVAAVGLFLDVVDALERAEHLFDESVVRLGGDVEIRHTAS